MTQKIEVVHCTDASDFVVGVQKLLDESWRISSTNCGFVDSAEYDYCCSYQAILVREEENV